MSNDEIIEMARQAGATEIGHKPPAFHFYLKDLQAFAKLVADKARQELREEVIYTWVPPSFVDFAIKTEREACAKICEQRSDPLGYANLTAEVCAKAIRARGEA
jgi:hypothetical protein